MKDDDCLDVKNLIEIMDVSEDVIYTSIKDEKLQYSGTQGKRGVPYKFTKSQVKKWVSKEFSDDQKTKKELFTKIDNYQNKEE